jgi:hypothetical protein
MEALKAKRRKKKKKKRTVGDVVGDVANGGKEL